MKLKAAAPTRIDLAGATLDIYPLYVFEGGGLTLNAAIDLVSEVEIETRSDRRIHIEAKDLGLTLEVSELAELHGGGEFAPLDLIIRILKFYGPRTGLTVRTTSSVPAGSGLGGSSSLLISLSTALVQLENRPVTKTEIIDFGANIEAQSLRVPTGKQDYYPPSYGGFNALWFGLDGIRREPFSFSAGFRADLERRILLGYSGASRFSGTSNWNMMKRYIDEEDSTVAQFGRIKTTAMSMYESLKSEDLEAFTRCLAQEWENRKGLADGVSTVQVDKIFENAEKMGALASKICGAGGGGCFITVVREGCQTAVAEAIEESGGRVLDYRFSDSGVRVA